MRLGKNLKNENLSSLGLSHVWGPCQADSTRFCSSRGGKSQRGKKRWEPASLWYFFSRLANKTRFEENIDVIVFIMITVNFSTLIPNKSTPWCKVFFPDPCYHVKQTVEFKLPNKNSTLQCFYQALNSLSTPTTRKQILETATCGKDPKHLSNLSSMREHYVSYPKSKTFTFKLDLVRLQLDSFLFVNYY